VLRGKQRQTIRCASDVPVQIAISPARVPGKTPAAPASPPANKVATAEPTIKRETKPEPKVLTAGAPTLPDTYAQQVMSSSYTVQPKDTLYQIAMSHGISVTELKKINNLTEDTIRPGQSLKVQK
jgi:LysM repeat protein